MASLQLLSSLSCNPVRARTPIPHLKYTGRRPFVVRCSGSNKTQDHSNSDSGEPIDWDASWRKARSIADDNTSLMDNSSSSPKDVGPRLTRWGGNVRGGKYRMGEGADRMLDLWGNGDAMLYAAMAIIVFIFVLLQFKPPSSV